MRWLEKLTCGGSEFHDDPENCYNFLRKRLESQHASLIRQQKRIRELEAIISENRENTRGA